MDFEATKIHMIGVGGSGMFPLALLLSDAGAQVRGIDQKISDEKRAILKERGIQVVLDRDNRPAHDLNPSEGWICIVSPAIPNHHPDLRAARRHGIQVFNRAEATAWLTAERETICVAGSHGKSTTTAMLTWVFDAVFGADIGYMIGADLDRDALPARLGAKRSTFLMEACEAYGALHNWAPSHAILTNVDDEHVEHYDCEGALNLAFTGFLGRVPNSGALVVNGDDSRAIKLAKLSGRKIIACGFGPSNHLRAIAKDGLIYVERESVPLGVLRLAVAGRHNIQNALLVLGMALEFGISAEQTLAALACFRGIKRRLQIVSDAQQPRVIDDFAHHPAEISTALQTLRQDTPGRLIAVLEPQLHSRVYRLADAFVAALGTADLCFTLPVAALGETDRQVCGNTALLNAFLRAEQPFDAFTNPADLIEHLAELLEPSDTVVVMGGHSLAGFAQRLATGLATPQPLPAAGASVLFGPRTSPPPDLLSVVMCHLRMNPDAPAIEMGHRSLSYRELWQRAGKLKTRLLKSGVETGNVVGVYLRPNIDRVATFVATLRLGAVYLPLDPALPEQRLANMIIDASASVIIVNAASPPLPDSAPAFVSCDLLGEDWTADSDLSIPHKSTQAAYQIYTSGTTGEPKGVSVTRGAISNYAIAARSAFKVSVESRLSLVSAFGFDVNIGDMTLALAAGACLVLPTEIEARPGSPMGRFVARKKLSHLSLTPSALNVIPTGDYPDLHTIIVAGEPCSPNLVKRWRANGERSFINAYGPTEATVEASFSYCDGSNRVSIGRPFDNIGLCILDEDLNVVELGQQGELCIFGAGLSEGYRNHPQLNDAQFPLLPSPLWAPHHKELKVYRTGDRAMINADHEAV
ncbi:MAG: AMP-binding protein, partial [Lysobacterales bacterium]